MRVFLIGVVLCFVECGEGDDVQPERASAGDQTVVVNFSARVGALPFDCASTFTSIGTTKLAITPLDLRFYVYDVALTNSDGASVSVTLEQDGIWQYQNLALLDFEDASGTCANGTPETHTQLRAKVKAGVYTGVRFKLGVPEQLNHLSVAKAPSPLNLLGLYWSWNLGYKFFRGDVQVKNASNDVFLVHLGSTGCVDAEQNNGAYGCSHPNVGEIVLNGSDPLLSPVVFDLASLFAHNDVSINQGGPAGCMSDFDDPDCVSVFARLGVNHSSGQPNAGTQRAFGFEK